MLDDVIKLFGGVVGGLVLGNEDVFFGGDIDVWNRMVYVIKVCGLMKENDYVGVMFEVMQVMISLVGNFIFQYFDVFVVGLWFCFNCDRIGDLEFYFIMCVMMIDFKDNDCLVVMDQIFDLDYIYLVFDFNQELIIFREM